MKCKLCSGIKFKELFISGGFSIEKCAECGLVRTSNFITPNYKKYHRDSEYFESEKFIKNIFQERFNFITKYKRTGSNVLDIGAATGVMLDIFKEHGYETDGVEPSASYKIALKKGHNIYHGTLESIKTKSNFDVVIANHVLEHITEPLNFLLKIKKLIKSEGVLYVDVPNFNSLSAQLSGKKWKYLLPDEHIHHFTPDTLQKILTKAGFTVIKTVTRSGVFETANPVKYLVDELIGLRKNFFYDVINIPGNVIARLSNRGTSVGMLVKKT